MGKRVTLAVFIHSLYLGNTNIAAIGTEGLGSINPVHTQSHWLADGLDGVAAGFMPIGFAYGFQSTCLPLHVPEGEKEGLRALTLA